MHSLLLVLLSITAAVYADTDVSASLQLIDGDLIFDVPQTNDVGWDREC